MQKLSRTDKYRDYRNKLNNDGEREIVTKELRELQEKIIFNEKRFGNSSRTESDLSRGRKDALHNDVFNNYDYPSQDQHTDDLDDIFAELNRYKRYTPNQKSETSEEHDDYIRKIKDIVKKAKPQEEEHSRHIDEEKNKKLSEIEKMILKEDFSIPEEPVFDEQTIIEDEPKEEQFVINKPVEPITESKEDNQFIINEISNQLNNQDKNIHIEPLEQKDENLAEFLEEKIVETPKSQIEDVEIKKADIQPTVPQYDHSKEFEEICMNVNSLAEEIESANSFGKDQYVPPVSAHKPENSFEGIQQSVKKELIGNDNENNIFEELEKELSQFNDESKKDNNVSGEKDKKKIVVKSEISNQKKEEYDNTVSLQVDKLMGEINSSKADNISAADIIKGNDMAKKSIDDHPGKTIAFEVHKKEDVPDNTIVLSKPTIDDSSIHTMSFKTEDLDIEEGDKGNTILNVILSILIIIAVGALGVIIYFFLLTRGII